MRLEKDIKVNHDIDVVFQIFSDFSFTILRVFLGISSIKAEGEKLEAEGKLLTVPYKVKGRAYIGVDEIKFIYDTDKGSGILLIRKRAEKQKVF